MNHQTESNKVVLHIDDDDEDREIIRGHLYQKDHSITFKESSNGKEGIAILKEAKKSGKLPCLIILDINMPGMDGWTVLKTIKDDESLSSIPVVVFTTASEKLYEKFANEQGVDLITKPSSPRELDKAVNKFLHYCA